MAQVVQQTRRQPAQRLENKEALARTLDDLLEQYLYLVHQYQTLQQDLCHALSNVRLILPRIVDAFSAYSNLRAT